MAIEWRTVPRGQSLGLLESTLKSKNRLGTVLAGSAGVGKTVLARHAVDRFAQRHGGVSVQWLAGTASARQIPFGAFSHLVDVAGVGDSPTLLRSARASLLKRGGQGLLLAIDDAHHLDNLSATLVHQLALTGSARFVITVRTGEQAPDAITSLWKDRLLDRLDVEPFDVAQTKSLLEAVLGGPMETSSAGAVFTASQGNPLYLRHLTESAIGSGVLRQVDGIWQLRGQIATRRLRTQLVAQLSSKPIEHVSARLRLAALAIESDTPPPVDDVVTSSWEAMRLGDLVLGERLAQSALDRSGGLAARLPLAHALSWLGRGPDADQVLTPVEPDSLSEWDLTAWTLPKAANQFWMLNQPEAAVDFLYAMRDRVAEPAAVATIDALAATFAMNSGDPRRAVEIAAEVLDSPASQDLAVAWAAATAALSSARLGRFDDVGPLAERGLAAAHPGLLRFTIGLGEITTLMMTKSVLHAQRLARHFMEFSELQQPGRAIGEVLLARTLIATG